MGFGFDQLVQQQPQQQEDGTIASFGWHPVKDEVLSTGGEVPEDDPRVAIAKEKGIPVRKCKTEGMVMISGAGREVYRDQEYVEIVMPMQRDRVHRPVTDLDRQRYAARYAAWKAGADQDAAAGTPLTLVPWLPPSAVKELQAQRIKTVEQLAAIGDDAVARMFGAREWREKAKAFIAAASGQAPLLAMQKDLERKDQQIDALKKQLEDIEKRIGKK